MTESAFVAGGAHEPGERVAEAARVEFASLREELKTRQQASHGAIGLALTAAGIIAGFAVGQGNDRFEILLVLPIVLSGLAAFYLENSRMAFFIGAYINDFVWCRMHVNEQIPRESWETYIARSRKEGTAAIGAAMGVLPGVLIFVVPSVAALVANADTQGGLVVGWPSNDLADGLRALWFVDLIALLVLLVYGYLALGRRPGLRRTAMRGR